MQHSAIKPKMYIYRFKYTVAKETIPALIEVSAINYAQALNQAKCEILGVYGSELFKGLKIFPA
jgi:hypothetical protein